MKQPILEVNIYHDFNIKYIKEAVKNALSKNFPLPNDAILKIKYKYMAEAVLPRFAVFNHKVLMKFILILIDCNRGPVGDIDFKDCRINIYISHASDTTFRVSFTKLVY